MSSFRSGSSPSHSLHRPYHARSMHSPLSRGSSVGTADGVVVVLGMVGGGVMVLRSCVVVVPKSVVTSSLHPQNRPGVKQVVLVTVGVVVVVVVLVTVPVLSLQPNQPLVQVSKTQTHSINRSGGLTE